MPTRRSSLGKADLTAYGRRFASSAPVTLALTRRQFVGGSLGLAAAAMLGCGPRVNAPLVVALGAEPSTLHPLLQTGLLEASVYSNVYDSLVSLDADGKMQPALAESWRATDDRTWVFRLRDGVSFHNGERFDSESVRFTLGRVLDPSFGSPIRAQLDSIERVETPDSRTAVIVTRRPFAPLLAEMTTLMMLPPAHAAAATVDDLAARPVGTGPFRFVEWNRADRLVLEANRSSWRGAPGVERVAFRVVPDPTARWAAVRAGEVDLATGVPHEEVESLEAGGLRVLARPGVQTLYLRLNARKPPLDDPRVRQAIAHAVDVERLLGPLYGGRSRRVNGPYPPEVFAYDTEAPPQRHDPARARELLQAARVEGAPVILETPRGRYPRDERLAQGLASQIAEAGLKPEVRTLEWATYVEKVMTGRGEHMFLLAGTNRSFDPHFTIQRIYSSASTMGRAYYGNPEVDRLAGEAAATLESERRRALYLQILERLRSDVAAVWIAQLDDLYVARPELRWTPRADSLLWLGAAAIQGRR